MKTLRDKVAVVTGGGIGRAIALALAETDTHVVVADVQADKAADVVADEVRARGVRTLAAVCDVSSAQAVNALADRAYAEFDRMDRLGAISAESVGTMVCNAILDSTLYPRTASQPGEWGAERTWLQYGPQAVGRT